MNAQKFYVRKPELEKNFTQVPNAIFKLKNLTTTEKLILCYMFSNADNFYITKYRIKTELDLHFNTVSSSIKTLNDLKYISAIEGKFFASENCNITINLAEIENEKNHIKITDSSKLNNDSSNLTIVKNDYSQNCIYSKLTNDSSKLNNDNSAILNSPLVKIEQSLVKIAPIDSSKLNNNNTNNNTKEQNQEKKEPNKKNQQEEIFFGFGIEDEIKNFKSFFFSIDNYEFITNLYVEFKKNIDNSKIKLSPKFDKLVCLVLYNAFYMEFQKEPDSNDINEYIRTKNPSINVFDLQNLINRINQSKQLQRIYKYITNKYKLPVVQSN